MPRLRRVSPTSRGWTRRRAGKGFTIVDSEGKRVPPEDAARVKALAIPPAWEDVWICPLPQGHLQAVGTDVAGRRQYLYHPQWRVARDRDKFDRITELAVHLPAARRKIIRDLAQEGMPRAKAAAIAVRLLDLGYFRIGGDAYVDANGSFGLTTLERRHVTRSKDRLVFEFVGKSGIEHRIEVDDADVLTALEAVRRRRSTSQRLLAHRDDIGWHDLGADDVNAYLGQVLGTDVAFTAKDFRTWHATVLAALALAQTEELGDSKASRKRAVRAAVEEVSSYLGNTPTIAKNSYVDPRILDLYESGTTIGPEASRARSAARRQVLAEKAVLALLARDT